MPGVTAERARPRQELLIHWLSQLESVAKRETLCFPDFVRFGEWLSLVEHLVRDQGVGGSNPLSPTNQINNLHPILQAVDAPVVVQGRHLGRH